MPVFRVEKTHSYTVMSNHHLRNKELSLKAKGLLSLMLSLPEDWDYTLTGLAVINRDNKDAIRTAVQELEAAGYVLRMQTTDSRGKFGANEYIIYEFPQNKGLSAIGAPLLENPTTGKPLTKKPSSKNPTQISTELQKTELPMTDEQIISYPISSHRQEGTNKNTTRKEADEIDTTALRESIRKQISYELLCEGRPYDREKMDDIIELMLETLCSTQPTMRIAGKDIPLEMVKERYRSINSLHMEYIMTCLDDNARLVRNIKQYLLTTLFNAPVTMNHYYSAQVNSFR